MYVCEITNYSIYIISIDVRSTLRFFTKNLMKFENKLIITAVSKSQNKHK